MTTERAPVELSEWLKNIDEHGATILEAIKAGTVITTTKEGFEKIKGRMREDALSLSKQAEQIYILNAENVILLNTLVYVLQSLNGVVAKAPDIFPQLEKLGISGSAEKISVRTILGKLALNPALLGEITDAIKGITAGFDSVPLTRINVEALSAILQTVNFDFSNYTALIQAAHQQFPKLSAQNG